MPLFTLTNKPDMFIGIHPRFGGLDQNNLYLNVWKVVSKDLSNPNTRSFELQTTTVGTNRPMGASPDHCDGLQIFNGKITDPQDINNLCRDLQYKRLRVNLDGYSYHEAKLGQQMGSLLPSDTPNFMRLNDLFDWEDYVDAVPTFKPEPSQTTWNRRSQTSGPIIVVNYEQLDKDLKHLRDNLKAKQEELDAKQKELEAKQKEVDAKQNKLEAKQKEADAKEKELEAKQKELRDNLEAKQKEVDAKQKELEAKQEEVDAKQNKLEAKQKEVDAKQKELEAKQKELRDNLQAKQKEVDAKQKELEAKQKEADAKQKQLEAKQTELDDLQKKYDDTLKGLPIPPSNFAYDSSLRRSDPISSTWFANISLSILEATWPIPSRIGVNYTDFDRTGWRAVVAITNRFPFYKVFLAIYEGNHSSYQGVPYPSRVGSLFFGSASGVLQFNNYPARWAVEIAADW